MPVHLPTLPRVRHKRLSRKLRGLRSVWCAMKYRCNNLKDPYYGGRGITFSLEWCSFKQFVKDMGKGYRPGMVELDRIDNDKGYYKENCQWLSLAEHHKKTGKERWRRHVIRLKNELRGFAATRQGFRI